MFCIFLCFLLSSWLWRLVNTGDTDLILQRFSCQYLGLKMFQMLRDRIYLDKNTEHQKRFLNPLLVGAFNVWFKAPVLLLGLFACHLILSKNMRGSILLWSKLKLFLINVKLDPLKNVWYVRVIFEINAIHFGDPRLQWALSEIQRSHLSCERQNSETQR